MNYIARGAALASLAYMLGNISALVGRPHECSAGLWKYSEILSVSFAIVLIVAVGFAAGFETGHTLREGNE